MGTHPIFESDFDCLTEKKNMGKRRRKAQRPPPQPILAEKGPINFEYGGDRTQQSKDAFKRRESERLAASSDCFIDPAAEMEDEIEIKELPHKDFGKSGKEWGTQAHKMMEKMGWKRGLGLGPRNQGVVNPVIPSGKYDGAGKRRGLGSLETAPDQKAKKAKSGDILQLPSYLRKRKKSPSLDPFIVGEILTKYKMSKSDLAIGKQSDHQYGYLNKTETCSINEQIERVCKLGRERLKAAPDLLQIGIHIHKKAREEEIWVWFAFVQARGESSLAFHRIKKRLFAVRCLLVFPRRAPVRVG